MFDFRHVLSVIMLSIVDWDIFVFSTHFINVCLFFFGMLMFDECCCKYLIHFLLFLIFSVSVPF
jgi:hypothetical protein